MMLAVHEAANATEVLAAVAALRRFKADAVGVSRGFVFQEALIRMVAVGKNSKDFLVRWPRR
jgi:hypothetical protein